MDINPEVSIVIPVYNGAIYCLDLIIICINVI